LFPAFARFCAARLHTDVEWLLSRSRPALTGRTGTVDDKTECGHEQSDSVAAQFSGKPTLRPAQVWTPSRCQRLSAEPETVHLYSIAAMTITSAAMIARWVGPGEVGGERKDSVCLPALARA
jgi:hypothetical protein